MHICDFSKGEMFFAWTLLREMHIYGHHLRRSRRLYLESQGSYTLRPREINLRNFACSPLHGLRTYNLSFRQLAPRGPGQAVPWLDSELLYEQI